MKTNLDLYLSAQAVAKKLMEEVSSHELHRAAAAAFDAEQHAKEDWDYWYAQFLNVRNQFRGLATQFAPSVPPAERQAYLESKRVKPVSAVTSDTTQK